MSARKRTSVRSLVVAVAAIVLVSAIAPAAGAGGTVEPDEPALVIELDADGDATVTLVSVYDLEDDDERAAFEDLRTDDDTRQELADRFADRMAGIAENAAAASDREMTVSGGTTDVRVENDRGIVTVSVEWSNLAAVEDDSLIVTEPFASGYEADRQLIIAGPDGATLETSSPAPDEVAGATATWTAGTELAGFETAYELGEDTSETDAGGVESLPGFGVVAGLLGLMSVVAVAATRRYRRIG